VLILRALGSDESVQDIVEIALGCALLLAAFGLGARAYIAMVQRARIRDGRAPKPSSVLDKIAVKPGRTVLIGLLGGIVVGITSAGSGSLIIIALMALYPGLLARELVGTDLVQAVPLVFAAAIGHLLFGDFQLSLTLPLLVGSVPGAFIGAQLSSKLPGSIVRRALAFVLLASALKLLGLPTITTGVVLVIVLLLAPIAWAALRRHYGFRPFGRTRTIEPAEAGEPATPDGETSSSRL
jgi:uncharacterized protein